jgi:putative copper export protein
MVGAIAAVGGTIFALWVVLPATGVLTPEMREAFHAAVRKRWSKIVFTAIGLLLLSGIYNFLMIARNFRGELPKWYHPLFGVKFLLAMAVFAIASLLAGRTPLAQRMRTNLKFWMSLNLLLAAVIIAISGVLRTAHPPVPSAAAVEPVKQATQADPASQVAKEGHLSVDQR